MGSKSNSLEIAFAFDSLTFRSSLFSSTRYSRFLSKAQRVKSLKWSLSHWR